MDPILGILLGALLGGAGKIAFDFYQRRQERRTVAAAIAGEISGILRNAEIKGLEPYFRSLSVQLRGLILRRLPGCFMIHRGKRRSSSRPTSIGSAPLAQR